MSAIAINYNIQTGNYPNALPVNVVVVYEDTPTGLRAVRSLHLLPIPSSRQPIFVRKLWRWDLLSDPLLNERAALEAGRADVIILSAHGHGELPGTVREWLIRWLANGPDGPFGFGLLLDRDSATARTHGRLLAVVRRMVERAGVDFFYGFSETNFARTDDPEPAEVSCLAVPA